MAAASALAEPEVLEPPPAEELVALFELAQLGDILAVQARAARLAEDNVHWRPFARRLTQLAGQFELEQVLTLLARYLPHDRHA